MPDSGGISEEAKQELRARIAEQSAQVGGAGDPDALQATAAERHVAAQLARAKEFKDPAKDLDPKKPKGLRIVEECVASGEPFFVFRAQDVFSNMVLVDYIKLLEQYGPDDLDMLAGVVDQLGAFKDWQKDRRHLVKYPD